jgi:hypothetical protein
MIYLAVTVEQAEVIRRQFFVESQKVALEVTRHQQQVPDVRMQDTEYLHLLSSRLENAIGIYNSCTVALTHKIPAMEGRAGQ